MRIGLRVWNAVRQVPIINRVMYGRPIANVMANRFSRLREASAIPSVRARQAGLHKARDALLVQAIITTRQPAVLRTLTEGTMFYLNIIIHNVKILQVHVCNVHSVYPG